MTANVYLDHNATTPLRPAAQAAMIAALSDPGNPSSVHGFGRAQRRIVEDAREHVARLAGVGTGQVVFTSGGTEANNMALANDDPHAVLVSAVEHASVLDSASAAGRIPVDANGIVDLDALGRLLAGATVNVIAVMLANNETGVIQPLADVASLAREHGVRLHVDAVQAAGKLALDLENLGADTLSLSAHKIGGPMGVGALIVRDGLALSPLLKGGGQERRRRAGTENVAGIAGFGAAAEAALADLDSAGGLARLRDRVEAALGAEHDVVVYGARAPRLANTSCLTMPGVAAETQVMALDLEGIAVSAGAACSSGKVEASHVLAAMGAEDTRAGEAIRISFGWNSTDADADAVVAAWRKVHATAQGRRGEAA